MIKSESAFRYLLKGSATNTIAKLIATALGFLASVLIAKNYGPDLLGKVATITSAFTTLALLAIIGNHTLILKLIPQYVENYNHRTAKKVYFKVLKISSLATIIVVTLWLSTEAIVGTSFLPGLEQYVFLIALLTIIFVFKRLNTIALRALGDYKIFSVFEILPAALLAGAAASAIFLKIPEIYFQFYYFLPLTLVTILSFFFVNKTFELKKTGDLEDSEYPSAIPGSRSLIKMSVPMFGITLSNALIAHFDIFMLNYYTTSSTVGIYSVYVKLAAISAIAINAINSMFAPTVSKLYTKNQKDELRIFSKKTTLYSSIVCLLFVILVIVFHKSILKLYGADFLTELPTFYLLVFSTLAGALFGSVGFYLNMTGHQVSFFRIMFIAALINVVLNTLFIPIWGTFGAATATLISILFSHMLATRKILRENNYTLIWSGGIFR